MKKTFRITVLATITLTLVALLSCEIGMGSAVDTAIPTVEIMYPPKNAIIRDTFTVSGQCADDLAVDSVSVSIQNVSTKESFGPYEATLNEEKTTWTVNLNQKTGDEYSLYESYRQWEYQDGSYIINAVCKDKAGNSSQQSSIPVAIDNTAPILIVSKPLSLGTETAQKYGRTLNLAGDIAEAHSTTKLTLYFKRYNNNTGSFIDSTIRTLSVSGFNAMSSDSPLIIACYYSQADIAAAAPEERAKLTEYRNNYLAIYGSDADGTETDDRLYYCGFLLEDNALLYQNPSDAGDGEGNKTTVYYINSDDFSERLADENAYNLNAQKIMEIVNGTTKNYNANEISSITQILSDEKNSASSTDISMSKSSKFNLNPANNPYWILSGFEFNGLENTFEQTVQNGGKLPIIINAGSDGILIKGNTVGVKIYHLGTDPSSAKIDDAEHCLQLIAPGSLSGEVSSLNPDCTIENTTSTNGFYKPNHFYEIEVEGEDNNGTRILSNGNRYGFMLYSSAKAPDINCETPADDTIFGTAIDTDGITITGKIITSDTVDNLAATNSLYVESVEVTDASESNPQLIPVSFTVPEADLHVTPDAVPHNFNFSLKITKAAAGSLLPSGRYGKFKYAVNLCAKDEFDGIGKTTLTIYVDNKAPELKIDSIIPQVKKENDTKIYVNGNVTLSGTVFDSESALDTVSYTIKKLNSNGQAADTPAKQGSVSPNENGEWEVDFNSNDSAFENLASYEFEITATDTKGNSTASAPVKKTFTIDQDTDYPEYHVSNSSFSSSIKTASGISQTQNMFKKGDKITTQISDDDSIGSIKVSYREAGTNNAFVTRKEITSGISINPYPFDFQVPDGEGEWEIKLEIIDTENLTTGRKTDNFVIAVDEGAPLLSDVAIENEKSWYSRSVTPSFTVKGKVEEGSSSYTIKAGERTVTPQTNWTDTVPVPAENGSHSVTYTARDKYGYSSTKTINYKVDNDKPVLSYIKVNTNEVTVSETDSVVWSNRKTLDLTVRVTDAGGSEVNTVSFSKDNTAWTSMKYNEASGSWTASADYTDSSAVNGDKLYIKAIDNAGNVSTVKEITLKIDSTQPELSVVCYKTQGTSRAYSSKSVYVNKPITIYGKYNDGLSGITVLKFYSGTSTSPLSVTPFYYTSVINSENDISGLTPVDFTADSTAIKSWSVTIDAPAAGIFRVCGEDKAGNEVSDSSFTFVKDIAAPELTITSLTNSGKPYQSGTTWYIRNKTDGAVTISGTTIDTAIDHTELTVTGLAPVSKTDANWSYTISDMTTWADTVEDADLVIKAYDKAGNVSEKSIHLVFDEKPPVIVHGAYQADYKFRGEDVYKYSLIRFGDSNANWDSLGRYCEYTYGQDTGVSLNLFVRQGSVEDTLTNDDKEEISGIAKVEYYLLPAGTDLTGCTYNNVLQIAEKANILTGVSSDETVLAAALEEYKNHNLLRTGEFDKPVRSTYTIYDNGSQVQRYGLKTSATISGLSMTTGTTTNLLFLIPVDNCGNKGSPLVLSIHADNTEPEVTTSSASSILTNGSANFTLRGSVSDLEAGIKAVRVKIGNIELDSAKADIIVTGYKDSTKAAACSLGDAAAYAEWTVTVKPDSSWFTFTTTDSPVVTVEAEDWAEVNGKGNINKYTVATLKVDTTPPTVTPQYPVAASKLNGLKTVSGTVIENNTPKSLKLYIKKKSEITFPSTLSSWGSPVSTISTEAGAQTREIYNYNFTDVDFYAGSLIGSEQEKQDIYVLLVAEDEAGNTSVDTNEIKLVDVIACEIDRNEDRPVVTVTNVKSREIFGKPNISLNVKDDDGIKKVEYSLDNTTYSDITPSSGSSTSIELTDGAKTIYFRVTDTSSAAGEVFTPDATKSWKRVRLIDAAGNEVITEDTAHYQVFKTTIDLNSPEMALKGIKPGENGTEKTDRFSEMILGGDTKSIRLRIEASDTSGIKTVHAEVYINDDLKTDIAAAPSEEDSDAEGTWYADIPCDADGYDGTLKLRVIAEDNAKREMKKDYYFNIDNTKPVIRVSMPAEETEQSGSITQTGTIEEYVKLYYAVSPFATSPDAIGTETDWTYKYYMPDDASGTENDGTPVTPKSLKNICKYVPAVPVGASEDEKQMSFQIMFDGDTSNTIGVHSETLNDWLVNMGITTETALIAENPFEKIVYLWLHVKAVDDAGNKKEDHRLIYLDPQGNRPKVTMTYPAEAGETLGGTVTFMGTAMGVNPIATITLKIDDTEYPVTKEGAGWTCPVDTTLLNDSEEPKEVTITVKASDTATPPNTSRTLTRKVLIDKDTPAISQNLRLVQWKSGYNASNGIEDIEADGTINFKSAAIEKNIAYEDGVDVSGAWNLIGVATDNSKVDKIKYKINGGAQIEVTVSNTLYTSGGVYIKKASAGTITDGALFSFPVGNAASNKVGSTLIDIEVLDDSDPKQTDRKFTVYYDNKAPVLIGSDDSRYNIDASVYNSNGYYNFSSVATEAAVDGVNQTGIERIAFYFTKELTEGSTTTYSIFDTAIAAGSAGNKISSTTSPDSSTGYNGLVYSDGLWWRKYTNGFSINSTNVTLPAADKNIHKGSLAKINGAIYSVTAVSGSTITLDSVPGSAEEVYFAIASVVDGKALNETVGKQAIINQGSTYIWNASINSKNMADGAAVLHYVVFDGAGNSSSEDVNCIVQNKAPRIVGMTLGTDENGNGTVEEDEFNKTSYTNMFAKGYRTNSDNTVTRTVNVTFPTSSTDTAPLAALKVKGRTVIRPEIVGGTGSISYTYTIAERNAAGTGWADPYYNYSSGKVLGNGTGENENTTVTLTNDIDLKVTDMVSTGIRSGNNQKFAFMIADSTPGTPLVATMNVIMDVYLVDQTAATNYIIPFYWKNINDNSLYNSKNAENWLELNGHIELPKDLNEAKDKDGNNNFTATGTGIHSLNPKVSGQIKVEGIARDEVLLKTLAVAVKVNDSITKTYTIAEYNKTAVAEVYTPSDSGFLKPAAKTMEDDGWEVSIQQATFGEYKAAGYISELPRDEDGEDYSPNSKVPYFSQEYGHVVHWVLNLDTQRLDNTIKAKTGVLITVSAKDQGEPASNGSYTFNNFKNNSATGTATPIANVLQTGGTLGEAAHTCKYTVDIVPYIGGVKSKLSERKTASGEKDNTTEYDRTALGHYPLASTEKAHFYGFNLKEGATVTDKAGNTLSLGAANTSKYTEYTVYPTSASLASFTSGKVSVTVDGVESLNNRNYNEAKGAYVPDENDDPDVIYNNCYNRTPNTENNYILTDDVILDVWEFDDTAAEPFAAGVVSDPMMKINPNNGMIGFAYQSGTKAFSMANGNSSSFTGWLGDYDNLSATGFAYDIDGNTYGTALGGDINNEYSVSKFCFITSVWQGQNTGNSGALSAARAARIEEIGQIGKKGQTGASWNTVADRLIDKARVLSPAIAVSGRGTNATVYMAYYDHLNREIRFRWGAQPKQNEADWTGTSYITNHYTPGKLSDGSVNHKYNVDGFQIIAENATTGGSEKPEDTKTLGKPGSYVDIAVLPAGSTGNSTGYDIVMIVWYDSKNDNLLYTYNTVNLANVSRTDFLGSAKTKTHWNTATTIFKKAGQYCKIAVDKDGGVHIAGYDSVVGDVRYAYLESYDASYNEATDSCYVDTNGIVGSDITLDVALDKSVAESGTGKPIPYIGYYGTSGPKLAYLNVKGIPSDVTKTADKTSTKDDDMFTGYWEVTEVPTPNKAPRDRINVGIWKDKDTGVIKTSASTLTASDTIKKGNGTMNPVLGYQIRKSAAEGYVETAQMK